MSRSASKAPSVSHVGWRPKSSSPTPRRIASLSRRRSRRPLRRFDHDVGKVAADHIPRCRQARTVVDNDNTPRRARGCPRSESRQRPTSSRSSDRSRRRAEVTRSPSSRVSRTRRHYCAGARHGLPYCLESRGHPSAPSGARHVAAHGRCGFLRRRKSLPRARWSRTSSMYAVILAGGGHEAQRRDRATTEAHGRDRWEADPVAHHEDLLHSRNQ